MTTNSKNVTCTVQYQNREPKLSANAETNVDNKDIENPIHNRLSGCRNRATYPMIGANESTEMRDADKMSAVWMELK